MEKGELMVAFAVLAVLVTVLNTVMTFLTLVTAGRLSIAQRNLRHDLADGFNRLVDRTEELTTIVESSMDCLVTIDARAAETSEVGEHAR